MDKVKKLTGQPILSQVLDLIPKGMIQKVYITIGYKIHNRSPERLKLRRIIFIIVDGKEYVFLTNKFKLPASQIALIYK